MKPRQITLFLGLLIVVALVGCQASVEPTAAPTSVTYTDPFAYCAAVGTIDAPDATFTGATVPVSIAQGLQQALDTPDTPLNVLESGSSWRCLNGEVFACFVGANLPCDAKANTDRTPTQEEVNFCQDNPDSDFIPATVTGRETVFEWRCREGAPEIVQELFQPDARGFRSDIWYQIEPAEAASGLPNPASRFCEEQGYQWEVREEAGGQAGYCLFPDGSECDEWAYFRGECSPGATHVAGAPASMQPLVVEVCNGQAQAMSHALHDLVPTQSEETLDDPVNQITGVGCVATITGTGADFESPAVVASALGDMLRDQGWTADPMLVADGPTGTAVGYRNGQQLCLVTATWEPDDSVDCPQDQPISACSVTPEQQLYTVTLNCGGETEEE